MRRDMMRDCEMWRAVEDAGLEYQPPQRRYILRTPGPMVNIFIDQEIMRQFDSPLFAARECSEAKQQPLTKT